MNLSAKATSAYAGGAGAVAATAAALCCAGAPIILSVLTATGLSFLRTDAILIPVILIALVIALFGFEMGRRLHRSSLPLIVGVVGSVALVAGVVPLHGMISKVAIGGSAIALLVATILNARLGARCEAPAVLTRRGDG